MCHNDGNPANNHYTNLRWDTPAGNQADRVKHGTHTRGERNGQCKVTPPQVIEIRRLYATGEYSFVKLGKIFDIGPTQVGRIVNREKWKHI